LFVDGCVFELCPCITLLLDSTMWLYVMMLRETMTALERKAAGNQQQRATELPDFYPVYRYRPPKKKNRVWIPWLKWLL